MITKHNFVVLGVAIIISVLILIFGGRFWKKDVKKPRIISYSSFYQQTGWGYDIFINNKLYIHQEIVPVLAVHNGFRKKEYAEKAARIMMQKMIQGIIPALTHSDLEQICPIDSLVFGQFVNH